MEKMAAADLPVDIPRMASLASEMVRKCLQSFNEGDAEMARSEVMLSGVEEQVKKRGCAVETDILQAREVGSAIIDVAREHQADLIIISLTYKRHFGEFCLGDVAPYVLKNAPCRVILDHQMDKEQI